MSLEHPNLSYVPAASKTGLRQIDRRETVSVAVAQELLGYLLSGHVEAGGRIPSERELSSELGVGRTAVREALKSLALLGILDVRQGNGTFLKSADSEVLPRIIEWGMLLGRRKIEDVIESRLVVETALARFAATKRSDEGLAQLRVHLNAMRDAATNEGFVEADTSFHLCLSELADNSILAGVLSSIRSLLIVWIARVVVRSETTEVLYREHERIFEAVEQRNENLAGAAMEAHLISVSGRLREGLDRSGEAGPEIGRPVDI